MQKLMILSMLSLFIGATALVGCRASAEVDEIDDGHRSKTSVKKTTVEPDGDKKVTRETRTH